MQFGLPAVTTDDPRVAAVSHVIQLAIAPVFVLTAVGTLLNVLTGRLSRIVDRTRKLEERLGELATAEHPVTRGVIEMLAKRAHLVSVAITCCVLCALFVCFSIIALFVGAVIDRDVSGAVVVLFVAAMGSLTIGLTWFLREVLLATRDLQRETWRRG
jgi:MFS family permease